ncbi:MAG: hypothetical protein FXF49_05800 [Flexistipes sinusarabici]|uniref:Uncharacterized protein n=1 Tax=Flexistipes sinusarabici TaxID=2352 RepID=A0A5D0MPH2_FLESI|nr:hypothetical protein [Flexistipes sinusarabici]TYB33543.1 MAG: hypothetical protein FXF49_05800 [Flexistipes sinusarabici]
MISTKFTIKYTLIVVLAVVLYACHFSFGFKTDLSLRKKYEYSHETDNLKFFYNVKTIGSEKKIEMAVKNASNMYIANMALNIDTKNTQQYFYIGNIKNLSRKTIDFTVPSKSEKLQISYRYNLTSEDVFLNPSSQFQEPNLVENQTILFLE